MFSPEACYLAGEPNHAAFNCAVNRTLYSGELLGGYTGPDIYFSFTVTSEAWVDSLAGIFHPLPVVALARRHYTCRRVALDWRRQLPPDCTVRRLDQGVLNDARLQVPQDVYEWMTGDWGSVADFTERGFGGLSALGLGRWRRDHWPTAAAATPARSAFKRGPAPAVQSGPGDSGSGSRARSVSRTYGRRLALR